MQCWIDQKAAVWLHHDRYNEWGGGIWNSQKVGLLGEGTEQVKYHFLGFNPGSDTHEQMAKLKNLMSGRVSRLGALKMASLLIKLIYFIFLYIS